MTSPMAAMALGITLFTVSSLQLGAQVVNNPGPPPLPGGCKECCEGGENDSTGSTQGGEPSSLHWNLRVGVARQDKGTDFQTMSRVPAVDGQPGSGQYNFDKIFGDLYHDDAVGRVPVFLELEVADFSGDVFNPSSLRIQNDGHYEAIRKNGFINQIVTDNAFTHIDKNTDGFRVRVWNKKDISLSKPSGEALYTVPTQDTLQDITFSKLADRQLQIVTKEDLGASGVRTRTKKFVEDTTADTLVAYTYAGEGTSGTLVEREELTYTNRGSRKWDYTLERKKYVVDLAADGTYGSGALDLYSHTTEVFEDFSPSDDTAGGAYGGRRLVSMTKDPDGAALVTSYQYYPLTGNMFTDGRIKSVTNPDGSWEYYEYTDSEGSPVSSTKKYSSWKDVSMANRTQAKLEETVVDASEITKTTTINGVQVAKTMVVQTTNTNGETEIAEKKWTGSEWATTTTCFYSDGVGGVNAGRMKWRQNADGTFTTWTYALSGGILTITEDNGAGSSAGVTAGIRTVTEFNSSLMEISKVVRDIDTNLLITARTADTSYGIDAMGRPMKWFYNGDMDDYEIEQHGCCGLEFKRDRSGATTTYSKDILKRTYRVMSKRSSGGTAVFTTTEYDGLKTTTSRNDGTTTLLVSETTRSLSGLSTSYKFPDADGDSVAETGSRVIVHNSGTGSTTTNTAPDGSTTVTVSYMDGSTKFSTDQASNTTIYDKGTHALNGGGLYSLVTAPNATQTTKSYRDQLGRSFRTEYADGKYSEMSYYAQTAAAGARGKLHTTKDADEVLTADSGTYTSYGYNAEGERTSVTTQLPDDQQLVQTSDSDVVSDGTLGVSLRTRSYTNSVLVSTSLRAGDGYGSKTTTLAGTSTTTRSLPSDGSWVVTSVAADGTQQRQFYSDGLLKSAVSFESGATLPATAPADITAVTDTGFITGRSVTYDAFGRTTSSTDARTGTVTYNGYRENGGLISMTDAGSRTTSYSYDKMGRTVQVDAPDTVDSNSNTLSNITYTSYYPTGQVKATWGDQTYARFNVYDSLNRLVELRTYQNLAHGTEPTSATTGYASTGWIYDGQRGWLVEKNYDGETDNGTTDPDYSYTAAGRLLTRTWERGVTTTYSYENGMLAGTDYSDSTPDVTYTYDTYGRVATVTQGTGATQNVHTYGYDATTLQLDSETVSYDNGSHVRTLDRHYDSLLRPAGYELKNGTTAETASSYGYDAAGRLYQVGTSYPLPASPEFTYGYLAESGGMVETVTGPAHTVTNTYESDRNVLAQKKNEDKSGTPVTVSHFTYAVNALGQRTSQTTAGSAFSSSFVRSFGYDAKGQAVKDDHSVTDAFDRAYGFDGIGNRTSATEDTTTVNYSANSKNQYSTIGSDNYVHDADGNLIQDVLNKYVYDAENRLVEVTDLDDVALGMYEYDYLSRRIKRTKTVGGTATWLYVYDGWNPLVEYTQGTYAINVNKRYTWGKDLSGGMQGAGGVGGLLSLSFGGNTYYPTYDGNGNVSEYLNSSGSVVAHYEYDAFGKTVVANGSMHTLFGHRFSTKRLNSETGHYYYGYRYYAPETGRWINRDPIEEDGGYNLYGFVDNNGVSYIDILGLDRPINNPNPADEQTFLTHEVECMATGKVQVGKRLEQINLSMLKSSDNALSFWAERGLEQLMGTAIYANEVYMTCKCEYECVRYEQECTYDDYYILSSVEVARWKEHRVSGLDDKKLGYETFEQDELANNISAETLGDIISGISDGDDSTGTVNDMQAQLYAELFKRLSQQKREEWDKRRKKQIADFTAACEAKCKSK